MDQRIISSLILENIWSDGLAMVFVDTAEICSDHSEFIITLAFALFAE